MKNFPRIYSLSTLGLRQHQQFDYLFHPFRTDFVGESGSGKSMIADLLQLIIVGSEVFLSATDSMDKRTPDGMVLKTAQGRGTEIAYAFLNIQITTSTFILLGTYLESSTNHSIAFIIQEGYDIEKLQPFKKPLLVADFISDEKILTLDELKGSIENIGLVCNTFSQKKKYHDFLFKHKILPIDLTSSEKTLKDYSKIIQSFSRGKNTDIHKGHSLNSFLFGEEKGKEIIKKYQNAVDDLQNAVLDYGRNREEISKINSKQKALRDLKLAKETLKEAEYNWLSKNCLYHLQQERFLGDELKDYVQDTLSALAYLNVYNNIIKDEIARGEQSLPSLSKSTNNAKKEYEDILGDYKLSRRIRELVEEYQCSIDALKKNIEINKKQLFRKRILESIQAEMGKNGLMKVFTSIEPSGNVITLLADIQNNKRNVEAELDKKNAFLNFIDINNVGSFGNWALQQQKPFTPEIESIIHHYSSISLDKPSKPSKGNRYIPKPEIFIEGISITDPSDSGFWFQMKGIKEYIPFVKEPILTANNMKNLKAFLASYSKTISNDIQLLSKQIDSLGKLYEYIINQKEFAEFIEAYASKTELNDFKVDDRLNFTDDELDSLKSVFQNIHKIETRYAALDKAYTENLQKENKFKAYIGDLNLLGTQLHSTLNVGKWNEEMNRTIAFVKQKYSLWDDSSQLEKSVSQELHRSDRKDAYINEQVQAYKSKMNTFKITETWNKLEKLEIEKVQALKEYVNTYGKPFSGDSINAEIIFPHGEREKYNVEKKIYDTKFGQIVEQFLLSDLHKFQTTHDYMELSLALLPEAFHTKAIEEDAVIDAIEKYLQNINEKNRELNKRKLQRIRNLLDEVGEEVSFRLDQARRIDNFLNSNEREITGGNRVRLKRDFSKEYPKDWLTTFQSKLDEENTLFASGDKKLSDILGESISIEEKILSAFYECGGHPSVKPKIEKLLDPNSYIELTFSMESASGQLNKGSTGQTYAAISLLCIARLSLIDNDDSPKIKPGIRFMPIDEAEGLGSNYDMLYQIAKQYDYQIISMCINPLGKFRENEQYLYILHKNTEVAEDINYSPFAIFCEADKEISGTLSFDDDK